MIKELELNPMALFIHKYFMDFYLGIQGQKNLSVSSETNYLFYFFYLLHFMALNN